MLSRVFHTLFDFGVLSWHKASKCSMGILGCFNPRTVLFNTCGLEIAHLIMCLDNYWRERNEDHAVTHSCKVFCYANCDWHCLKLMGFFENMVLPEWFIRVFDSITSAWLLVFGQTPSHWRIQHCRSPFAYLPAGPPTQVLSSMGYLTRLASKGLAGQFDVISRPVGGS